MEKSNQNDWQPLESNPQVINTFVKKLGLRTEQFSFQELLSREEWALQMIVKPVIGVMLCFEQSPAQTQYNKKEAENLKPEEVPKALFFMKQKAQNACGTIAIFHIVINKMRQVKQLVKEQCYFKQFEQKVKNASAQQIGDIFNKSADLQKEHQEAVKEGQSSIPCSVNNHFIAFIESEGNLFEMDGCKRCPVNHGQCKADQVLQKSAFQIGKFMQRDPDNLNFSMIVLSKNSE